MLLEMLKGAEMAEQKETIGNVELVQVEKQMEDLTLEAKKEKIPKSAEKSRKIAPRVNEYFADKSHLEIFQEIAMNLVGKTGKTIAECKKLLQGIFIHILDYINGNYADTYEKKSQLIKRCRKIGFFPKEKAKSEGLRDLLEKLF